MIKLEQLTSDIDTNKDSPPSPDDFQAQEAVKAAREKPGILSQVVRVDTGLPEQWTAGGKGHAYAPGQSATILPLRFVNLLRMPEGGGGVRVESDMPMLLVSLQPFCLCAADTAWGRGWRLGR